MRIQESSRMILLIISILSCIGIGSLLYTNYLTDQQQQIRQKQTLAVEAIDNLVRGSDILTAAIRNYAATGNEQFKSDFQIEVSVTRGTRQGAHRATQSWPFTCRSGTDRNFQSQLGCTDSS